MNIYEAIEILELTREYSDEDIKKNYKRLLIKHHPDKSKDPDSQERFIKVQEAYKLLTENKKNINDVDFIKNIFKIFVPQFKEEKKQKIDVTIKEYVSGTTKVVRKNCTCEKSLCLNCAGCGYNIPSLGVCMECLGDGYYSSCNCYETVKIQPFEKNNTILLIDDNYFIKGGKLYYNFNITFKESLIGFEKTFVDPNDTKHLITVHDIIKNGDGYSIKMNGNELILLFKIDYPKQLSQEVKQILSDLF